MELLDGLVTVYRADGARQVVSACFQWEDRKEESPEGEQLFRKAKLFVTGEDYFPQIGDRVLAGVGPETVDWETFLPVTVAGLCQIQWVRPYYLGGELHHVEAGSE